MMIFFFLQFLVSSWGTHLLSFSFFPICLKYQMTKEWLTLSSCATSCVVLRSALVIALNWLLSVFDGQPLSSSFLRLSFAKLLEPPLHCISVTSSWANCIVDVLSNLCCFYNPFWARIIKLLKFTFCLASFT